MTESDVLFIKIRGCHHLASDRPVKTSRNNPPYRVACAAFFCAIAMGLTAAADAQTWPPAISTLPDAPQPQEAITLHATPLNILKDQSAIWTSPFRMRSHELGYLIPLGLATTLAVTTDHQAMTEVVSHNPDLNDKSVTASDGFTGILLATLAVLFATDQFAGNPHARETGILDLARAARR